MVLRWCVFGVKRQELQCSNASRLMCTSRLRAWAADVWLLAVQLAWRLSPQRDRRTGQPTLQRLCITERLATGVLHPKGSIEILAEAGVINLLRVRAATMATHYAHLLKVAFGKHFSNTSYLEKQDGKKGNESK